METLRNVLRSGLELLAGFHFDEPTKQIKVAETSADQDDSNEQSNNSPVRSPQYNRQRSRSKSITISQIPNLQTVNDNPETAAPSANMTPESLRRVALQKAGLLEEMRPRNRTLGAEGLIKARQPLHFLQVSSLIYVVDNSN